jgi:hypothetical protein
MHCMLTTAPDFQYRLQAPGCELDASSLQVPQKWAFVGNCHEDWNVVDRQLQLLHICLDCLLQLRHVVLVCHAGAVQQVVAGEHICAAAVDVVYYAGDSGRAVAEVDIAHRGVSDIVEHAPACSSEGQQVLSMWTLSTQLRSKSDASDLDHMVVQSLAWQAELHMTLPSEHMQLAHPSTLECTATTALDTL